MSQALFAAEIDTPITLPPSLVDSFTRDGFARIKGLLQREAVLHFGQAITAATLRLNTDHRPLAERSTYDRAFLQVMNLWREDESARALVFSKRLASAAAALLGVRAVRLYHDQSLYKEPGGGVTPAHADQYYWPLSSDRTVTAWIPLQTVQPDMGPLGFYRGSHTVEIGRDLPISDDSEARICADMEARGFIFDEAAFALGDVSFHRGWTFHRAGPNASSHPRSVMTIIYMDAEMRVAQPTNAAQRNDLAQWLPGLGPGDLAASVLNPILWTSADANT
jgi:ectoine hydroxylase-related dioxygenase (phytanoyl-CoA dioxygenase family)